MLNTKYIIGEDENGRPISYINPDANGNAWFIEKLRQVETADQEIRILDSLNTKREAVILKSKAIKDDLWKNNFKVDSTAIINLVDFRPNYLKYRSTNASDGFAIFSENYYKNGWNAYLDGELTQHTMVNYVLRGMEIPAGVHTIEFKFEPKVIQSGITITLASSIIMFLVVIGGLFWEFKKK